MASTPDSMPSLGHTSHGSNEMEGVSRVLFRTPEKGDQYVLDDYFRQEMVDDDEDSMFRSELSIKTDRFGVFNDTHAVSPSFHGGEKIGIQYDEGIETLHGSYLGDLRLTSYVFAGLYNIFDASQQRDASTASINDDVTEVTNNLDQSFDILDQSNLSWERKTESLERENATLKEILASDSATILRLKTELSMYREDEQSQPLGPLNAMETKCRVIENDVLLHNEAMIQQLQDEIHALTQAKPVDSTVSPKEIQQLRLENELLASQIVENESELLKTVERMKLMTVENTKLKIANQQAPSNRSLDYILITQVASLTTRISDVERLLDDRRRPKEDRNFSTSERCEGWGPTAVSPIKVYTKDGVADTLSKQFRNASFQIDQADEVEVFQLDHTGEVEVTIDGVIMASQGTGSAGVRPDHPNPPPTESIIAEKRGRFCDCFRPSLAAVEI